MIQKLGNLDRSSVSILQILKECDTKDFYYIKDSKRIFINNKKDLKGLIKDSNSIYTCEERGIVLVWKSLIGELERKYVKLAARDFQSAKDLIMMLLWNYSKELYVKTHKNSFILDAFRANGFSLVNDRGSEVLLYKKHREMAFATPPLSGTSNNGRYFRKN